VDDNRLRVHSNPLEVRFFVQFCCDGDIFVALVAPKQQLRYEYSDFNGMFRLL